MQGEHEGAKAASRRCRQEAGVGGSRRERSNMAHREQDAARARRRLSTLLLVGSAMGLTSVAGGCCSTSACSTSTDGASASRSAGFDVLFTSDGSVIEAWYPHLAATVRFELARGVRLFRSRSDGSVVWEPGGMLRIVGDGDGLLVHAETQTVRVRRADLGDPASSVRLRLNVDGRVEGVGDDRERPGLWR